MIEDTTLNALSLPEQDACGLAQAAVSLDQARLTKDGKALAAALETNLQLWVAIRALVGKSDNQMPTEVKTNLMRLSNFVADTTFKDGTGMSDDTINTLININLQISEGLLEGQQKMATA